MENKMKIVFLDCDTLGYDISLEEFKKFGEVIVYGFSSYEETIARLQGAEIVVTNKTVIDKNIIDNSDLKLICVAATGMNNIDLEYAKKKNIQVKNVKGYSTHSVTQLTFSFVLNFVQEFEYYTKYTNEREWEKSKIFVNLDKPFYELKDKNWGIIGLGEIGKNVAKIATAFGSKVSYFSTSGNNNYSDYERIGLEEILKKSDIITIHAPLTEFTKNLIGRKELEMLKNKAILVNVGRGGIVNENDLAEVLDEKEIYVGLDVVEVEPIASNNPLNFIKNKYRLKMTPHIGWASIEARNELTKGIINNIKTFVL
jgi:glycerate dehydrogenase